MTTIVHQLSDKDRNAINHNGYLLGRLMVEDHDAYYSGLGAEHRNITPHKDDPNRFVIHLQAISPEPKILIELLHKNPKNPYISTDANNRRFLQNVKYFEATDKLAFLKDYLSNRLVLFRPKLTSRRPEEHNYENAPYHFNFEFVYADQGPIADAYTPVPSVKKGLSHLRFDKVLQEQGPFQLPEHPNFLDTPEFIHCDGYIYYLPLQSILQGNGVNLHTYYCQDPKLIKKLPLPDGWGNQIKCQYKDLTFIPEEYARELRNEFNERGQLLEESEAPNKIVVIQEETKSKTKAKINELEEYQFIELLKTMAQERNLVYSEEDLINFHVAVKTSTFTILGGMSGVGKTQLALLYADALKLKQGDNLLILPIKPSYTEPSDILGYLHHQTGAYVEAETGFVSFLKKAEKDTERLYMLIMDELNLGQVEFYLSDFLSILELPQEQRRLQLFSPNAFCHNKELRDGILLGNNLCIIGTSNFDETTKDFSNRMLDRSNVIYLEKSTFLDAKQEEEDSALPNYIESNYNISTSIFREKWTKNVQGLQNLSEQELNLLDRIHEEISDYDSQTGVSFRIVKGIARFLVNIPKDKNEDEWIPRKRAYDYQIKHRILTKIRGHREQIGDLVGSYDMANKKYNHGSLALLLEDNKEVCEDISIKFLEQKAKELMRNGYTV